MEADMKKFLIALSFIFVGTHAFAQAVPVPAATTPLSSAITTGLTYQVLKAALAPPAQLRSLTIENNNASDTCWIEVSGAVVATNTTSTSITVNGHSITAVQASVMLLPGGSYTRYYPYIPNGPIVGTCTYNTDSIYVDVQ
jgi:hypothetical protein